MIEEYKDHLKNKFSDYLFNQKWAHKKNASVPDDKALFYTKRNVNKGTKTNNLESVYMIQFFVPFSDITTSAYDFVINVHKKMYGGESKASDSSGKIMESDDFRQNGSMLPLNEKEKDVLFRVNVEHKVKILAISDRIFDIVGHIKECPVNKLVQTNSDFNMCYCVLKDINQPILDHYKISAKKTKGKQVKGKIHMSGWLVVPCSKKLYDHYNSKKEVDFEKLWDRVHGQKDSWNGYMVFHFMHCDPCVPSVLGFSKSVVESHMIKQITSVLSHCTS